MVKNKYKSIGILGGMGPYATISFFEKIISMTNAKKDWDYPRLIIDNNTKIPSRSRHVLYNEKSPVNGMIKSCKQLENYPVDIIAIPCNSACCFLDKVKKKINIPIIDIIEITANSMLKHKKNVKSCAVISGISQYKNQSYKKYLEKNGFIYVHHSKNIQSKIEKLIENIKKNPNNKKHKQDCKNIINQIMVKYKVDSFILGCTEFGCIEKNNFNFPIVDSSHELAKYIVTINK
ncbi:amino acid racemase [Pelagibacterales bacterium]|nr:amino acid racemase [Pelagibacterales bacterium]